MRPALTAPGGCASHPYRARAVLCNAVVGFTLLLAPAPGEAAEDGGTVIVALGDSLTSGFGLRPEDAFPARLEAELDRSGLMARVVNAGVSGDTSAGGLARVGWALKENPDIVIVELGANDALRGIDPAVTQANLDAILERLAARGVRVLLAGMRAPPNMGQDYGAQFAAIYPRLAAKHRVALYPFFLEGVAAEAGLNQADGLHPNGRGVGIIVRRIAPYLRRLIEGE